MVRSVRQARRAIISHTLPLTLTDRLWTGMRRDATIGLYRAAAGWYDPYSTQGIHAGVSVPRAPVGLRLNGRYQSAPGASADSIWGGLGSEAISELFGAGLGVLGKDVIPGIYQAGRRSLLRDAIHLADVYNIRRVAATKFFKRAEYWAQFGGRTRWLFSPIANPLQGYNAWQYDRLAARADWQWRAGLDRLDRRLGGLEWLNKYGDDALDLGIGTTLDIFEQGWNDLPMALSGDLTWGQYGARMLIQTGGSLTFGYVALKVGKALKNALSLSNPAVFVVDLAIGTALGYLWEEYFEPGFYQLFPSVYPKSQRVGPTEDLPW